MNITEPTLILDETRARRNIANMAAKAQKHKLKFTPHFKTHQSKEVGEWFKESGVSKITVSSVGMAIYFAKHGWREITIAFPVNVLQIESLNKLAQSVQLNLLVDNEQSVEILDEKMQTAVNIYIEIDTGGNRSGVKHNDRLAIKRLAKKVEKAPLLKLIGFYSHAGHTYAARSAQKVKDIATKGLSQLNAVKQYFEPSDLMLCWGDTPSCSIMDDFSGIDAISPGNFVFYDVMQRSIGACRSEDIAVAMYCPVVSKKQDTKEVCIYGGAVHFSKDTIDMEEKAVYGLVIDMQNWQPIKGSYLKSVSQEHGIVQLSANLYDSVSIGDTIAIFPIHSCLTAEAMGAYRLRTGQLIEHYAQKNRG